MAQMHYEDIRVGYPFIHTTVENLLKIKSTRFWKNNNVRVIGRVCYCDMSNDKVVFESPIQHSISTTINLNVEEVYSVLPQGRLLEIFGFVDVLAGQKPMLTVLHHKIVSGISINSHYKAVSLRSKYISQFSDEEYEEMPESPCSTSHIDNFDEVPNIKPNKEWVDV